MEQKELNKKKLLWCLPLLVLPFLALGFYALGGGRGDVSGKVAVRSGLDTALPAAQLKGRKEQDKLALYDQAKKDSAALKSLDRDNAFAALGWDTSVSHGSGRPASVNEQRIRERLTAIRQQVSAPPPVVVAKPPVVYGSGEVRSGAGPDIDRLERLLKRRSREGTSTVGKPDPEMQQLNGMLEKIMDIQHPERVMEGLKARAKQEPDSLYKAIRVVVAETQKVVQGSSVKLRLVDSMVIKGLLIPKGTFLFGICQVANQRLLLDIKTIRLGTSILPVDLSVYDLDAMPGIAAPEALLPDALRSGSDNALQGMQLLSMDQGLAAQAAGAGIETAKSLFSKKVKRVKVKLKVGRPVLLRVNKN
jgi:hypothetical protein